MKRSLISIVASVVILACISRSGVGEEKSANPIAESRVMPAIVTSNEYPRAYFFRHSEGYAANQGCSFERWNEAFSRLQGIQGKVLEEEVPGRSVRNIDFFNRFKSLHPEQMVLLHFNGNARDPRYKNEEFFAGHWIYYNGATILSDVPAEQGETVIHVSNPRLFRTDIGRYKRDNDDIGLCTLDENGCPDWSQAEQVQLLSVDIPGGTIRVRRGCYGTKPLAFSKDTGYAAAHLSEGPWGNHSHLLWMYNYATCSPRDQEGRSCSEVLVDDLGQIFENDGQLAPFDGIQFDVLHHRTSVTRGNRGPDVDADGQPDAGWVDGRNVYGIGVIEHCRRLRERLGDDFLILADGMSGFSQRAITSLNGIESEGWPHLADWNLVDWSGGLNRHFFWQQMARPPVFNYINHKFTTAGERPGQRIVPDVPPSINRMVFAVATFTDSAVCYSTTPEKVQGELIGIWDELVGGTEKKTGWLGRPLGPAVRLAEKTEPTIAIDQPSTLVDGAGEVTVEGVDLTLTADDDRLKVRGNGETGDALVFRIKNLPCSGPDCYAAITLHADPLPGYPADMPRVAAIRPIGLGRRPNKNAAIQTARPPLAPLDDAAVLQLASSRGRSVMTLLGDKSFKATCYYPDVEDADGRFDLEIAVEGTAAVTIDRIAVYAWPDVMYRRFEHGIVLANPSWMPHGFNLEKLAPGERFRRIEGTELQDPKTNNGQPVGEIIELPPKDAIFLRKI